MNVLLVRLVYRSLRGRKKIIKHVHEPLEETVPHEEVIYLEIFSMRCGRYIMNYGINKNFSLKHSLPIIPHKLISRESDSVFIY